MGKSPKKHSASNLIREGNRLRGRGNWGGAEEAYRRATEIDAEDRDAWTELACLLIDNRRFSEAVVCCGKFGSHNGAATNDELECIRFLAGLVSKKPGWARGQYSLGCAYEQVGDRERAREHLANTLRLEPGKLAVVEALYARMFWAEEKWSDAIAAADRALRADSGYYLALVVRGRSCGAMGRMGEAVKDLRRSLDILPDSGLHSSLLFDMNHLPETTPEILYAEARRWNTLYAAPLAGQIQPHRNSPEPERRLRIGYVSPDLYAHPIAKFLMPVFARHDRSQFEVFAYSVGTKSDGTTAMLSSLVEHFVPLPSDAHKLAERIRADEIDILVDLAGHTTGDAYLAFALKPAPVQISWLGVLSTSGMSTMDYFLGDAGMPCPGTEHLFSETVVRLTHFVGCYRPDGDASIGPAPYLSQGYITFGCFNNPKKITQDVVKVWSAILHLVAESRLMLKYFGLDEEARQAHVRTWFGENGIEPERILFAGGSKSSGEYLAEYGRVDIALDPFPYNGGSTTLDALWMGVPVVTLAGRLPVQRTGASILSIVGLPDLVTHSPEQYVSTAVFLAGTMPKIPDARRNLREAFKASPILDEIGFVHDLEAAFRNMWRTWCGSRG